jgi:hypothetical protein
LVGLQIMKRKNEGEWNGGWMGWRDGTRYLSNIGRMLMSMFDLMRGCLK